MSSNDHPETHASSTTIEPRSAAQDIPTRTHPDGVPSSTPLEMNSLHNGDNRLTQSPTHQSLSQTTTPHPPMRTDTTTALQSSQNPPAPPLPTNTSTNLPTSTARPRSQSTAIGPSSDQPAPLPLPKDEEAGPSLKIMLLLLSGARHPFNLDARYISKRSVTVAGNDPYNLSVYKVKELILREWRDEWEAKPSSPGAIRLISFGKVLDDKAAVKDLRFNQSGANVVHMSIKPQDFVEEEDAKGAKAGRTQSHDGAEGRSVGCRCIVM